MSVLFLREAEGTGLPSSLSPSVHFLKPEALLKVQVARASLPVSALCAWELLGPTEP